MPYTVPAHTSRLVWPVLAAAAGSELAGVARRNRLASGKGRVRVEMFNNNSRHKQARATRAGTSPVQIHLHPIWCCLLIHQQHHHHHYSVSSPFACAPQRRTNPPSSTALYSLRAPEPRLFVAALATFAERIFLQHHFDRTGIASVAHYTRLFALSIEGIPEVQCLTTRSWRRRPRPLAMDK